MKLVLQLTLILIALMGPNLCMAEPTSGPLHVYSLRPYANSASGTGGAVYVRVDSTTFCGTDTFKIDLTWGGAREMYAAVLSALATGKPVQIEIPSACTGWGQTVQSIYILNQ